jgi:hypothetical protein
MKLLAVRLARAIWLTPQYFLNPKGVFLRPAIEVFKDRYSFLKTPLDKQPNDPKEEDRFEHGVFIGKNGPVQIMRVALHSDGIVVDTRSSTDDGDAFLEDALNWISKEYGLPPHTEAPIDRVYASELNVIFEKTPRILDSRLTPFLDELSSIMGSETRGKADFLGLQLSTDQTLSNKPVPFRFEREINTPFAERRYYSSAPMKTDVHLRLLHRLEEVS